MENINIKIKLGTYIKDGVEVQVPMPKQAKPGDVGWDLIAARVEDKGDYYLVDTGVSVEPPENFHIELFPRSSIYKKGLQLSNSIGLIDSSYRGRILAVFYKVKTYTIVIDGILHNITPRIEVGERILQMVVRKTVQAEFVQVEVLSETERGSGRYGSSGSK